jgi:diaminohydroxyphosphoribosylaminopyrimidine deaminase/5-amino-6-(5-phosphoribosylamino)uracil reductase
MALALTLGRRGLGQTWPNPAVGAVIVAAREGGPIIVGRGWTQAGGRPHAEREALHRAGAAARGAALYVTLEPCSHHGKTPPCADAIIEGGIARVICAMEDPNPKVSGQGHARLRAHRIPVDIGAGAEAARKDHAGHIRRMRDGRPHVTLKLAVSPDGKAGLAGRKAAVITGSETRERVHLMRAMNDAILTGIGTALADDPLLTCRLPGMAARSPVRVVLDPALRLPAHSRLVNSIGGAPLWIIANEEASSENERLLRDRGADIVRVARHDRHLDLHTILRTLAGRGVTRLMIEGGPTIAAAFVRADLVDEAAIFRGPEPIGAEGIGALEGLPIEALTQSGRLKAAGAAAFGRDTAEWFERV